MFFALCYFSFKCWLFFLTEHGGFSGSPAGVGGEGVQLGCEGGGKATGVTAGNGGLVCEGRDVRVTGTGRGEVNVRKTRRAPIIWSY